MTATRIVVAEDNVLMRHGICTVLTAIGDIEIVGECDSLPALLAAVESMRPDVVISDIRMPPTHSNEGIEGALEIRSKLPATGVIVLSQHDDPDYVIDLFRDGDAGLAYLLKENVSDMAELQRAIAAVKGGGSWVDPQIVRVLVNHRSSRPSVIDELTAREGEVLSLIAEGLNNAAIGARLTIAEKSVQRHINAIFAKLGLTDQGDSHRRVKAVLTWLADR